MDRRVLEEEGTRESDAKDAKEEYFELHPPVELAPQPPRVSQPSAQDLQLESNYVSLADTGISTFRSRGGSVDVTDVPDGTRRAHGFGGEVLPEDHAEDRYDDTSSDEDVAGRGVEGGVSAGGLGDRHSGAIDSSGTIGGGDLGLAGLRLGAGEVGIGGSEIGRQEIVGIAKLEKLEMPLPQQGLNGSGLHEDMSLISPDSVPRASDDFIQCPFDDVLSYWKDAGSKPYSAQARVARAVYGHPASSEAVERDFGKVGNLLTCRRSRIDAAFVEISMFTHFNFDDIP